jgi:dolichyl-phosphate beta-glucosyltransferase
VRPRMKPCDVDVSPRFAGPASLVLVVPCHNEADRLQAATFLDFVRRREDVGLLFVDDGSTDDTAGVLARLAAAAPGAIDVLRLDRNQGKAEAVRRGIVEALALGPSLVGFWDADLATPLDAVEDFTALAAKRPEVEIILGSRVLLMGRDIRRKASRHYLGRVFATAASLTLGIPVYDTQCGAKVFRPTPAVAAVFAEPFRSTWIFDVELLARYLALPPEGGPPRRSRIYELTVPAWHDIPGSKVRPADFARALFDLAAIRRRYPAARGSAHRLAGRPK